MANSSLPSRKSGVLRRGGYALVASALVVLILMSTAPNLSSPTIQAYCFLVAVVGMILILIHRAVWVFRYWQFMDQSAYCMRCGWYGTGRDWFRFECCPECEKDDVQLIPRRSGSIGGDQPRG